MEATLDAHFAARHGGGGVTASILGACIPERCDLRAGVVHWVEAAGLDFSLPFFAATVEAAAEAGHVRFATGLNALGMVPHRPPAALVFSTGRAGSTLLTKLLERPGQLLCLREPTPLNDLLADEGRTPKRLAQCASALAGASAGRPYLIKFSSWNLLHAPLLLEAFPSVPVIVMRRDPGAIARSFAREPAPWMQCPDSPLRTADPEPLIRRLWGIAEDLVRNGAIAVDHDAVVAAAASLSALLALPPLSPTVERRICAEHARHPGRPYRAAGRE